MKKDQKDLLVANEMEDPLKELVLESIQKRKDHLTAKKMCQSKALYSAMTLAQKSKILGFYYDKNLNKWMKSKNLKLKELVNRELNKAVKYPLLKMKDTIKEILINESPELLNDLISSIKYWDLKPFERCIFLQIPLEVEDYFKFSLNHISKPNLQEYWDIILRNPLLNTLFDNWELYNRLHIDKITDHKIKPFLLKHNETEQRSIVHSSFFEQFLDILKQNEISLDEILDNYGNTALHLWSNHQCDIVETSNETKKWYLSSKFIMEADDFEPYLASENIRIDDLLKNKKWQGWTNYHPPKLQEYITVEIQHPYYNHKVIHFCLSGNISFNIESKNKYHKTPLHVATENGFSEIIELLLTRNAHVEAKDENGCSPLHIACQNGNKPNFDLLISFKANIEAQTKNLETPLHLACLNGHLPIVQALIQMKANIEAKDHVNISSQGLFILL
uniref:Uncharacterized protein n=1 Tax=Arcella intermedia TaxID=1963864 RepID=A0A6B2L2Z3_9EUKA